MAAASPGHRGRVLLVDDDDDLRPLLAELMRWDGWEVVQARDGCEGQALFASVPPDVLVLDQRMPGMTGSDLFRKLRAGGSLVPVVLISAAPNVASLAANLGIRHFLRKPFDMDEMLAALRAACARPA